jgi:hypothetical protein
MVGRDPLLVTRICNDPYVPPTEATLRAANWDVAVAF